MSYIEDSIISIVFSPENSQVSFLELESLSIPTATLCSIFNAWLSNGSNCSFAIVNHHKCLALK